MSVNSVYTEEGKRIRIREGRVFMADNHMGILCISIPCTSRDNFVAISHINTLVFW